MLPAFVMLVPKPNRAASPSLCGASRLNNRRSYVNTFCASAEGGSGERWVRPRPLEVIESLPNWRKGDTERISCRGAETQIGGGGVVDPISQRVSAG